MRLRYAVAAVLLVTAYYTVPQARAATEALSGLLAIGAIEYGVRRYRPQRVGAWRVLAIALALLVAGDTTFAVLQDFTDRDLPYPSTPDVFYLVSYLPLTVALFWLGRPVVPSRDLTTMIDAISLTLGGSLVVWITVVRPAVTGEATVGARIASVVAWVGYVAVLAASVRVVLAWRRNVSVTLLALAVLSFLIVEIFYGNALVAGTWVAGGPVDVGYFAFTFLCGAAALEPSMRDVASPPEVRHTLGPVRLTLIAVTLLVAPTALLVEVELGQVQAGFAIAIVSALVSVLMLIRLAMTGRAYQRRAAREHAARIASQALVSSTSADDVVAAARAALRRVITGPGPVEVELVPSGEPDTTATVTSSDGVGRLAVPLAGSDRAMLFIAPRSELTELSDLLASLADQAALALARIDLIAAAGREERERYFRTLVLTSTDVILISRAGTIEYATPSGRAMFGHDVVGHNLDELVRPPGARGDRWPDTVPEGVEALARRPDGTEVSVLVQRRDLTGDPTVGGVVTTLRDVSEERALKRDLEYRASHDELTGLANVRAWGETLRSESERRRPPGEGVAVIFLDLDNFKQINDRHGHAVGDEVLAQVAARIRAQLRSQDLAARVGGDEFAALLRGLSHVDDARGVAQRLAASLAQPIRADGTDVVCRASAGLAYTEGDEQVPVLVRQADTALYAAKEQGKGRWAEYHPEQRAPARPTPNGEPLHPEHKGA